MKSLQSEDRVAQAVLEVFWKCSGKAREAREAREVVFKVKRHYLPQQLFLRLFVSLSICFVSLFLFSFHFISSFHFHFAFVVTIQIPFKHSVVLNLGSWT